MIDHAPDAPASEKKILTFQWEEDGQLFMETHLFLVTTPSQEIQQKSNCPMVRKNHTPRSQEE